MLLPNADKVLIDLRKIEDYVLNFEHFEGNHKARVFELVLGLTNNDAEYLIQEIKKAILIYDAMKQPESLFGEKYIVDFDLKFKNKVAVLRTAWIIEFSDRIPRLVTCYIK